MAAIFRREFADEGRFPNGTEGVSLVEFGEAGKGGVDEDHPAARLHGKLVQIDLARRLRVAGNIAAVEMLIGELAGPQHVLKPPHLCIDGEIDPLRRGPEAHGAGKADLVDGEDAVGLRAHKVEKARLIGGEGKTEVLGAKPGGKPARAGNLRLGHGVRLLRRFGWFGRSFGLLHDLSRLVDLFHLLPPKLVPPMNQCQHPTIVTEMARFNPNGCLVQYSIID
jgi:hypothetical protein